MNPYEHINNLPPDPRPSHDQSPATFEQVFDAVKQAARQSKIRAIAGGWGFSSAGCTPGLRLRMPSISGVEPADCLRPRVRSRPFDPDPLVPNEEPGPLMRVYAGTPFDLLNQLLGPITVVNQPGFGGLSFGGVMMVGGHGSGIRRGNIASQVRSMDLVVVDGDFNAQLLRVEAASDAITDTASFSSKYPNGRYLADDALFNAAKVSFGTMGVLLSAVIDTRPAYRLEEDRDLRSLWDDFDHIIEQVEDPSVAGVHLWLNPYSFWGDYKGVQSTYRRCADMKRNERGWGIRDADSPMTRKFMKLASKNFPFILPAALEYSLTTVDEDDVVMPSWEALDFGNPNRLLVAASSCSLPADKDLRHRLAALLEHFKKGFGKYWVSSPIGIRWVKASNAPLAPQVGRDSVMIEVPVLNGTPNQKETLEEYVRFVVDELGGRPHWGQRFTLTAQQLRKIYGDDNVNAFIAARRQLDPRGVFDNGLTAELAL